MTSDPAQDLQPSAADEGADSALDAPKKARALTLKSILLGILGAGALAALSGYNDDYLKQASLTSNHFPVFAFGVLFLLVAVWNPIAKRICKPLRMSTGELVVFLTMTLAASWVAGSGLNRYFFRQIILPWLENKPQWEAYHTLDYLPRDMFPLRADPAYVYIEGVGEFRRYDVDEQGEIIPESDRVKLHGHVYQTDGQKLESPERLAKISLAVARPVSGGFDEEQAFQQAQQRFMEQGLLRDPELAKEAERINELRATLRTLRSQGSDIAEQEQIEAQLVPTVTELTRQYYDLPQVGLQPASQVDYVGVRIDVDGHGTMTVPQIHTYEVVYNDFANGKSEVTQIPWRVWMTVMVDWGPLLIVFAIMVISVAMLVHRQWSRNEQLSYPLAQVGHAMLQVENDDGSLPRIFRSRIFWIGAGMVMAVHMLRLMNAWFPENVPPVRLGVGLTFFWDLIPHAKEAGIAQINHFYFYPMLFALAYFVSSEIGLTLGISQFLLAAVSLQFFAMSGTRMNNSTDVPAMAAGSYLIYGLIILYVGRHYYWRLFSRAIGLGASDDKISTDGILAARVFILAFGALWMMLTVLVGVDWLMSLIYVLLLVWMFLIFSRIICETGMPFMQTMWNPALVMTKILGYSAVGAAPMVVLYYMSTIFCQDNRECLQPYAATAMKIGDESGVRPRRIAMIAVIAVVAALATGFGARLYANYNNGALSSDNYSSEYVPKMPGNNSLTGFIWMSETGEFAKDETGKLVTDSSTGLLSETDPRSGLSKLGKFEPDRRALGWFIFGGVGVAIFFFMRLRFTAFPLHPVLFLVWGTYPMWQSAYSFLIGWAVKEGIVRFGGGRVYQELKPFFIGVVAGELIATLIGVLIGIIYNLITGEIPPRFTTMAG